MFKHVFSRAASCSQKTSYRAMASVSSSTEITTRGNQILATSSNASFPYPANLLIQVRIKIAQEAEKVLISLEQRKVPIEETVLSQVETVRGKVLDLEYSNILGSRATGRVLSDFTWGMDPQLGFISEDESRDNLAAELRDITTGLVREVNQIISLVESRKSTVCASIGN
ncbi:hypothetical protein BDR26DRAFT_41870 [Obelidium mucronatum]|nr:hypothetical protein BDR26DRAFT_41870 [Obelidium mucronatum]